MQTLPQRMTIGLLHPGEMGAALGRVLREAGHAVLWLPEGRSAATHQRARQAELTPATSMAMLCRKCDVIIAISLPSAAQSLAESVLQQGFQGIYLDANAIEPSTAAEMAVNMQAGRVDFVDGAIIGPPPASGQRTHLVLAGERATELANRLQGSGLETVVAGTIAGQASALKLCDSLVNKGLLALLYESMATAESLGVRMALMAFWGQKPDSGVTGGPMGNRLINIAQKSVRFADEMAGIARTLERLNLPAGPAQGAQDVFSRLARGQGCGPLRTEEDVVRAVTSPRDTSGAAPVTK